MQRVEETDHVLGTEPEVHKGNTQDRARAASAPQAVNDHSFTLAQVIENDIGGFADQLFLETRIGWKPPSEKIMERGHVDDFHRGPGMAPRAGQTYDAVQTELAEGVPWKADVGFFHSGQKWGRPQYPVQIFRYPDVLYLFLLIEFCEPEIHGHESKQVLRALLAEVVRGMRMWARNARCL